MIGGARPCEVCGDTSLDVTEIPVGQRNVWLCRRHAARCREAGARSLEDVRRLFLEPGGRRSLLGRRSPQERRQFPPRPDDGRRTPNHGRRKDD